MENEIIVPDMPYMRDIFQILKNGGFISEDCLSDNQRRYYQKLNEHYQAYFKYFLQLGYYLERGYGFFHLCESRPANAVQSKLRTDASKYICWIAILVKFRPELSPGTQFKIYELQMFCDQDDEMRSVLPTSTTGLLPDRITALINDLKNEGFLDISPDGSTCYITSAFRYLKEYVSRIRLYGEHAKFNLSYEQETQNEDISETETVPTKTQGAIDMEA